MFRVVENKPNCIYELRDLSECSFGSGIIMAERNDVQDILVFDGCFYHWSSLYIREIKRTKYSSIREAIQSRLNKGMDVFVFQNRGEFRDFLKYNGKRY